MKTNTRFMLVPMLLLVALFGLLVGAPATQAQSTAAEYEAKLRAGVAYPGAKGEAEYKERTDGNKAFEAEVEKLSRALRGQSLSVVVDGNTVGTAVVSSKGEAKFKADSRYGQTVPVVVNGSTVAFTRGADTVASGAFVGGVLVPEVKLESYMAGSADYPGARGEAEYKVESTGRTYLEVEAKNVAALSGQSVSFYHNGNLLGSATVNYKGEAKLKLDSALSQVVPAVVANDAVEAQDSLGVVIAAGVFGIDNDSDDDDDHSGGDSNQATEMKAIFVAGVAYPTARGDAEYEVDSRGNREFEVEVKRVSALRGQTLSVSVDGTQVGTAVVNSKGEAKFKLQSKYGQIVPTIVAGSLVEVSVGGVVVASGGF